MPTKNLLTYVPVVRRELIRPAGRMDVASHFTLVHEQLVRAKSGFNTLKAAESVTYIA